MKGSQTETKYFKKAVTCKSSFFVKGSLGCSHSICLTGQFCMEMLRFQS